MAMPPLTRPGISWPLQATVGHIAVTTQSITGNFKAGAGTDATQSAQAMVSTPLHRLREFALRTPQRWQQWL